LPVAKKPFFKRSRHGGICKLTGCFVDGLKTAAHNAVTFLVLDREPACWPLNMTQERKYLCGLAAAILMLLIVIGGINLVVDPYSFFNVASLRGINAYKTFGLKLRLRKPVHIYQRRPEILIMGSSRGGHLRCDYLTPEVGHCYNGSLRGITPYEEAREIEHAITVGHVKRIVWKMSYGTFAETVLKKEGFDDDSFARESDGITFALHKKMLDSYLYALFSWETFQDSRLTVDLQDRPYGWFSTEIWSFEADGSWRTYPVARAKTDPQWVYERHVKHWGLSTHTMVTQLQQLHQTIDRDPHQFEANYNQFETALDRIYRHHIALTLILSPEHASYLQLMQESGLWPYAETWKRRVVAINEQVAARYGVAPALVWDFGGFNQYSMEPTWEALQAGQSMQWYEDIVHFNEALGKKMFEAINAAPRNDSWYTIVNSSNIDAHLQTLRQQRDQYLKGRQPIIDNTQPDDKSEDSDAL